MIFSRGMALSMQFAGRHCPKANLEKDGKINGNKLNCYKVKYLKNKRITCMINYT